jgi:hypothetical protein
MRVLVTGGAGNVGRAVVERLVQHGWDVLVIGRRAETGLPEGALHGAEYAACDITRYDDVLAHMRGCQAVAHLAAIPAPGIATNHDLFHINVAGTFNIFEAAAVLGLPRVVQASSINAFGCFYNLGEFMPDYLPIDEAHPIRNSDPYSFSKQVIEEIGDYYWRRERMSSVALRLPGVWRREHSTNSDHRRRIREGRALVDAFAALGEDERRTRLAELSARTLALRGSRPYEDPAAWKQRKLRDAFADDALAHLYAFDRFVLWTAIDERDAAQAVELGLTAPYEGSHVLFVNDTHNCLGYDARTLGLLFFPDAVLHQTSLQGTASLVSAGRASALLGFAPEYPTYQEV